MSNTALQFKGARSKSRTQQHFKDEVNINTIMRKARRSGVLPYKGDKESHFQDLTGCTDYLEAQNRVIEIKQKFSELPANIRNKFKNEPDAILKYLQDPKNADEARELGLLRQFTKEEIDEQNLAKAAAEEAAKPAPEKE